MKCSQHGEKTGNGICIGHCVWCGAQISVKHRRGSPRRFCTAHHRTAYSSAARRWGMAAFEAGLLSLEDLRAGEQSVHAFKEALAINGPIQFSRS